MRNAAAAWGNRGEDNGINVTFKSQAAINQDAGAPRGQNVNGAVRVNRSSDGQVHLNVEFSESEKGGDLRRTIAHEGSHIEDDLGFLTSLDPNGSGRFNAALNFYGYDTEFKAFETGALANSHPFAPGPAGYAAVDQYLRTNPAYTRTDNLLEFDPSIYPQ